MTDYTNRFRVPTFCPVCSRVMRDSRSNITYYSWDCCSNCFIAFVEHREDRWSEGWRPTEQEVEDYYRPIEI